MQLSLRLKISFFIIFAVSLFFICVSPSSLRAQAENEEDDMAALEIVVQGYYTGDYGYALPLGGEFYIALQQMAQATGITMDEGGKSGYWGNSSRKFTIDLQNGIAKFDGRQIKIEPRDIAKYAGQYFFSADFYRRLFSIRLDFNQRRMIMTIDCDEPLPFTQARLMRKKSLNVNLLAFDSFAEYSFDERIFDWPVIDLSLSKNWSSFKGNTSQSDSYAINAGMLFLGMDADFHVFGSSYDDHAPKARALLSRVFLKEPGNFIKLKKFQAGDITGIGSGFFTSFASGRGAQISSFKDFVTSADKMIAISGSLPEGWEAELYLGEQLIRLRQPSSEGRYEFADIPVFYGLNDFKVVLYGPMGEIRFEEKRYYSGRSPVSAGELGYNISAYQQGRFLFENNEPYVRDSLDWTFDSVGYYGVNDRLTIMSGFTSTPVPDTPLPGSDEAVRQYGMLGAQLVLQGASLQYNALYGFENDAMGHHFDAQGDIWIGNIFARYEHYGDLKSVRSIYNSAYLKNLFESRLSGIMPFARIPWYLSFMEMNSQNGERNRTANARLSYNIYRCFFSLEDYWENISGNERNFIIFNMSRMFGILTANLNARYETSPRSDWTEIGARVDYRMDKNTFFSLSGQIQNRSDLSLDNLYRLNAYCGKLFLFGALTLNVSVDSDDTLTAGLNYRISFGKNPHKAALFADAKSKLSNRAAVAVMACDERNRPISGVDIRAQGQPKAVTTDEDGIAILTDMPAYAKTAVLLVGDSVEDISLTPLTEKYKYVLRPGTVYPLKMQFIRKGEVEGQIKLNETKGKRLLMGYTVQLRTANGKVVAQTYTDSDGYFILEPVPFGYYKVAVIKDGKDAAVAEINLNSTICELKEPLRI